jgi:hypothetical protein
MATTKLLTKEISVYGQAVTLYSRDGWRWFSNKKDALHSDNGARRGGKWTVYERKRGTYGNLPNSPV